MADPVQPEWFECDRAKERRKLDEATQEFQEAVANDAQNYERLEDLARNAVICAQSAMYCYPVSDCYEKALELNNIIQYFLKQAIINRELKEKNVVSS